MPVITCSKTTSEQSSDLVTFSTDDVMNCPRTNVRSRQSQTIITRAATNGSPLTSVLVAHATQQSAGFRI